MTLYLDKVCYVTQDAKLLITKVQVKYGNPNGSFFVNPGLNGGRNILYGEVIAFKYENGQAILQGLWQSRAKSFNCDSRGRASVSWSNNQVSWWSINLRCDD